MEIITTVLALLENFHILQGCCNMCICHQLIVSKMDHISQIIFINLRMRSNYIPQNHTHFLNFIRSSIGILIGIVIEQSKIHCTRANNINTESRVYQRNGNSSEIIPLELINGVQEGLITQRLCRLHSARRNRLNDRTLSCNGKCPIRKLWKSRCLQILHILDINSLRILRSRTFRFRSRNIRNFCSIIFLCFFRIIVIGRNQFVFIDQFIFKRTLRKILHFIGGINNIIRSRRIFFILIKICSIMNRITFSLHIRSH